MPKLKDGVEFTLGMTIVFADGREFDTSKDFFIEEAEIEGEGKTWLLGRTEKAGQIAIGLLYSSQESRIRMQAAQLEEYRKNVNDEIDQAMKSLLNGKDITSFLNEGDY